MKENFRLFAVPVHFENLLLLKSDSARILRGYLKSEPSELRRLKEVRAKQRRASSSFAFRKESLLPPFPLFLNPPQRSR